MGQDFRNVNWGDTGAVVQIKEKDELSASADNNIVYKSYFEGKKALLYYYFENGKLNEAIYKIDVTKLEYMESIYEYFSIFDIMIDKYGPPENDKELNEYNSQRNNFNAFANPQMGFAVHSYSWKIKGNEVKLMVTVKPGMKSVDLFVTYEPF